MMALLARRNVKRVAASNTAGSLAGIGCRPPDDRAVRALAPADLPAALAIQSAIYPAFLLEDERYLKEFLAGSGES